MLHVVFEDAHLLVVNKASGVLSQPGRTRDDSVATQVRHAKRIKACSNNSNIARCENATQLC